MSGADTLNKGFVDKIVANFNYIIFAFYTYCLVFPSVRLAIIGTDKFKNWGDFLFTESPSIITMAIAGFAIFFLIKSKKSSRKLTLLDWLLLGYFVVSIIWGGYLSGNIFLFLSGARMTYIPMLFYIVGRILPVIIKNEKKPLYDQVDKLLDGIFFIFILLAVVGLIIYFVFPSFEIMMNYYVGYNVAQVYFIPRMTSIVWQPVIFGFLMSLTCTYYFFRIMQNGNVKYYIYISITCVALLLSVCRGGIISFLIGALIISFFYRSKWRRIIGTLILILGIFCGVSYFITGNFEVVNWIFASSKNTFQMKTNVTRVHLWQEAMNSLKKSPEGYGIGKAGWTAHEYLLNSPNAAPYATDGWYLKTACEIGIYGLAVYIIITAGYFFNILRFVWRNYATILTFCLAAIAIVHAQNVVSNVLDFYPYITIYWLLLGLAQAIIVYEKNKIPALKTIIA